MGPERKLYQKLKKNFTDISLIRLENNSLLGTPDILACNSSGHFFTIELKVTSGNRLKFSPHQIAFHVKHPENTFILVLDASCMLPKLYEGKRIRELVAGGLTQAPCATGYAACRLMLEAL
jgi:hypothetical protein